MMEHIQHQQQSNSQVVPHLVQVYHQAPAADAAKHPNPQIIHISHTPTLQPSQANLTYQSLSGQPLSIPVSSHLSHSIHDLQPQNISLESMGLSSQGLQALSPQVLQSHEINTLQITQHVILPNMLLNGVPNSYYGQFDTYQNKEQTNQCAVTKLEPIVSLVVENKNIEYKDETRHERQLETHSKEELQPTKKKKSRSLISSPSKWACNVRKMKHQRGEAYISRRGKFVPEKKIRNTKDCLKSCKYKCSTVVTDTDREHLFKAFYSLNANEKKHFLLNTTERTFVKHPKKLSDENSKRKYSFKYFFLVRAVRHTVCKNFYLGTLAISQKPVYNVHLSKSDFNVPKPDGRGTSVASTHSLPSETKERVRRHIMSFKTVNAKPVKQYSLKKQYISSVSSIKHMYKLYYTEARKDNADVVKESMYRKILKTEFNVHFKKVAVDQQLCAKCKGQMKKK